MAAEGEGQHHEGWYCGRRELRAAAARGRHRKTGSAQPVARRTKEARLAAPPAAEERAGAAAAVSSAPCSRARGPTAVHDAPSEQPASRKAGVATVRAPTGASATRATEPAAASSTAAAAAAAAAASPARDVRLETTF